jgi:hypothetical protein
VELAYETRERAPATTQLETTPDRLTLTLPLNPAWPHVVGIAFAFALAALFIGRVAYVSWYDGAFLAKSPTVNRARLAAPSIAAFSILLGAIKLRSFRRAGHLPRTLVADAATQTLAYRPERSARWRQWPLPDPTSITVGTCWQLFPCARLPLVRILPRGERSSILLIFPRHETLAADQFVAELRRIAALSHTPKSD